MKFNPAKNIKMGTNLNQVFILNTANLEANGNAYTAPTAGDAGIWVLDSDTPAFRVTALFDASIESGAAADNTDALALANPLWLVNQFQLVQGTAGNPLASPIIQTRNIRSITFDPFEATEGHKSVLTPNSGTFTGATIGDVTIRVIVRTTPTDQLSFYDGDTTNYTLLNGSSAQFPLGAFNTTNHKAISVEVKGADFTNAETFIDAAKIAIDGNGILNKLVTVTDGASTMTITSNHVGFTFDVVVTKTADNTDLIAGSAAANLLTEAVTGQVLGAGNAWQVLGDEIRCRYRQGNFNRMYLPQNPATLTQNYQYHKITIEYEHNWPNSTGIAPAGALNQAVLYAGDSSVAMVAGDTNIDAVFALSAVDTQVKYIW